VRDQKGEAFFVWDVLPLDAIGCYRLRLWDDATAVTRPEEMDGEGMLVGRHEGDTTNVRWMQRRYSTVSRAHGHVPYGSDENIRQEDKKKTCNRVTDVLVKKAMKRC
jgi:hypothetical protein